MVSAWVNRLLILSIVIMLAVGVIFAVYYITPNSFGGVEIIDDEDISFNEGVVIINGQEVSIAIAETQEERQKGLMNVKENDIDNREGMLFVFEQEGRHSFWMKDTPTSLDIIWISQEKEVVHIQRAAEPCLEYIYSSDCRTYIPPENKLSLYVLEVEAGVADELGIKEGSMVEIEIY